MPNWVTGLPNRIGTRESCRKLQSRLLKITYFITNVVRIYANVYETNPSSMKVLENAGFSKCGIHRKSYFKNGLFIDCHYYELLKL